MTLGSTPTQEALHHHHLEQARAQVIDLLTRQAVEATLVERAEGPRAEVVASLLARQHQAALEQRLARFHPADIAFVLEALAPDARLLAWSLVRPERRGAVLLEASRPVLRSVIAAMDETAIAESVRPLGPDAIADLLAGLPDTKRSAVLERLGGDEQVEVRSILSFPPGSVGAMMDLEHVAVREDVSLEAVLRLLRRRGTLPAHTTQLFVVDRNNALRGLLSLSQLVLLEPETEVGAVMRVDPVFFYTDDHARDAAAAFEKYDLISAPVVNLQGQVVGRLTVDAVVDHIAQRAQDEGLRKVGLSEEDEDLFAPVVRSAQRRWPWLALNLATAFAASRVIGIFEDVIATLIALATLMPIVASIGGNSGNQSVALVIRGLALDQLGPAQLRKILLRELSIGAINGAVWGAVLGMATLVVNGSVALALVIAAALLLNLLVAALVGVVAPILLHRFGRDPAMGSSIVLTATTDSMGFFIFLGLAALFLV